MAINKVVYGNTTLIDISDTTADPSDVVQGKYYYDKSGVKQLGTNAGQSIVVTDEIRPDGGIIKHLTGTVVSGALNITQDGTFDVSSYAQVIVNVGGGGEIEAGKWTPTSDIARATISFVETHTEPPRIIVMSDTTGSTNTTTYTNYTFIYVDNYAMWGQGIPYSSSAMRYSTVFYTYRTTTTSSTTVGGLQTSYSSADPDSSSTSYARYFATETGFHPYTNSTTRYWRSGRKYEWIAFWR